MPLVAHLPSDRDHDAMPVAYWDLLARLCRFASFLLTQTVDNPLRTRCRRLLLAVEPFVRLAVGVDGRGRNHVAEVGPGVEANPQLAG